jgi:hypothetical protein
MVHPYLESWCPVVLYTSQKVHWTRIISPQMGITTCKCEGRNCKETIDKFKLCKISNILLPEQYKRDGKLNKV